MTDPLEALQCLVDSLGNEEDSKQRRGLCHLPRKLRQVTSVLDRRYHHRSTMSRGQYRLNDHQPIHHSPSSYDRNEAERSTPINKKVHFREKLLFSIISDWMSHRPLSDNVFLRECQSLPRI